MAKQRTEDKKVKMWVRGNYNLYGGDWNVWFIVSAMPGSKKRDYLAALSKCVDKEWDLIKEIQEHPERTPKRVKRKDAGNRRKATLLRWKIFSRDDFTCKNCGAREDLEVDHIHPISKGGSNEIENLQTLCKRCNVKKFNKT